MSNLMLLSRKPYIFSQSLNYIFLLFLIPFFCKTRWYDTMCLLAAHFLKNVKLYASSVKVLLHVYFLGVRHFRWNVQINFGLCGALYPRKIFVVETADFSIKNNNKIVFKNLNVFWMQTLCYLDRLPRYQNTNY